MMPSVELPNTKADEEAEIDITNFQAVLALFAEQVNALTSAERVSSQADEFIAFIEDHFSPALAHYTSRRPIPRDFKDSGVQVSQLLMQVKTFIVKSYQHYPLAQCYQAILTSIPSEMISEQDRRCRLPLNEDFARRAQPTESDEASIQALVASSRQLRARIDAREAKASQQAARSQNSQKRPVSS